MLDGVNATALALMAGVSYQLRAPPSWTRSPWPSPWSTLVLVWRTKINNAWYIAGGALVGLAHSLLT